MRTDPGQPVLSGLWSGLPAELLTEVQPDLRPHLVPPERVLAAVQRTLTDPTA